MTELVTSGWLTTDDVVLTDGTTRMGVSGGGALYSAVGARIWSDSVGIHAAAGRPYFEATRAGLTARGIASDGMRLARGNGIELWLLHESEVVKQQVAKRTSQRPLELDDDRGPLPAAFAAARGFHIAPHGPVSGMGYARQLGRQGAAVTMDILCDRIIDASLYRDLAFTAHLDAFLPSEMEIREVWSVTDPMAWLADTARTSPCHMVGKFVSRGSVVVEASGGRIIHVPAIAAEVLDTTGAGDAFCGGFMAGLASGHDPAHAAAMGTVSASFVIESVGALATVVPSREARDRRLEEALAGITIERRS